MLKQALILILLFLPGVASPSMGEGLPSAFNGRDLSGWKAPGNNRWWTAAQGILRAQSGPERRGSTLYTEAEYGDFVLQFEYKLGSSTADTGIFIRCDQDQIQIGESWSLKRDMTGSPYIAGKGYPEEAKRASEVLRSNDWNSMTIVAVGANYVVWLNNQPVLNFVSETAVTKGPIGIQLHPDRDMSVEFRNIRIASLER